MEIKYCTARVELVVIVFKFFQISIQEQLIVKNVSYCASIVAEIQESGRHLVRWLEHLPEFNLKIQQIISLSETCPDKC